MKRGPSKAKLSRLYNPWKIPKRERDAITERYFEAQDWNAEHFDRKAFLKEHPEEIPIEEENKKIRSRGFDDDGIRSLMAAICLKTCADYQRTLDGRTYAPNLPPYIVQIECRRFFDSEMMAFFTNGMEPEEIETAIRKLPAEHKINTIWHQMEK